MNEQKVLIVDRNSCVISTLCEYLSDELYDVFTARDGVAGFKTLRREKIDLAVVDKDNGNDSGSEDGEDGEDENGVSEDEDNGRNGDN